MRVGIYVQSASAQPWANHKHFYHVKNGTRALPVGFIARNAGLWFSVGHLTSFTFSATPPCFAVMSTFAARGCQLKQ